MKAKVKYLYHEGNEDLFAYFPNENDGHGNFMAYSHIGQHSACCMEYANESIPATNEQIKPLRAELESLGYELDMITERLIKDPYFCGYPTDFEAVLKELNKDRSNNGLYTQMEENDLEFDEDTWISDYCESIGVRFERVMNDELWYYITLESFPKLRKTDWDFDEISEERYISNYDELTVEVLEDDIENQAEDLMTEMNEQLWKFGGVCFGENLNGFSLIELNGGLLKYCINTDFEIEISPIYEANESQLKILEQIKSEVE